MSSLATRMKSVLALAFCLMAFYYGFKGDGLTGASLMGAAIVLQLDARIGRLEDLQEESIKPKEEVKKD